MVRNYVRKTQRKPTSPSKLQSATDLVNSGWAVRAAARQCNIPKSCLWDQLKRMGKVGQARETEGDGEAGTSRPKVSNAAKRPVKKDFKVSFKTRSVFTTEQEDTIMYYCLDVAKMGYGLSVRRVRELPWQVADANKILTPDNWKKEQLAGIDWFHGFQKRYDDKISIRTPEACSIARAMGFNKPAVETFYKKYADVLSRHESFRDGSRVFNIDETSTSTVQNVKKLVSPKGVKQVHQVKTAERGVSVTTSVFIGAHGTVLPPVMIFPRKVFRPHMLINCFPGTLGLANDKGYNTKETFYDVIVHFIKCTKSSKENPTLLLCDNVETHFSTELLDLAKESGVVILTFPPHCTHKLQPLDVGFFGPFKSYYDTAINSFILSNPATPITIYHIAGFVREALGKAATASTIINSFAKTGIYPFNNAIFQDSDFIMASVTEKPDPNATPQSETPADSESIDDVIPLQEVDEIEGGEKPENFITPISLKGYPKAKPQASQRRPRRRGKCMVATDTPEKQEIAEREAEIKKKQHEKEERKKKREYKKLDAEFNQEKDVQKEQAAQRKKKKKKVNVKKKSLSRRVLSFDSDSDTEEMEEAGLDKADDVEEMDTETNEPSEGDYCWNEQFLIQETRSSARQA